MIEASPAHVDVDSCLNYRLLGVDQRCHAIRACGAIYPPPESLEHPPASPSIPGKVSCVLSHLIPPGRLDDVFMTSFGRPQDAATA